MLPLAGIVEDLPDPANRVTAGPDGEPRLEHRFGPYDLERGRRLGRLMAGILKAAGAAVLPAHALRLRRARRPPVRHPALRHRPGAAVLDPDCRLFGHPNLFVVDGSFFPTSLGVGPGPDDHGQRPARRRGRRGGSVNPAPF